MCFLFFFVHPSKYHLYRITINELIRRGHEVDIVITSKDVLEDLVKKEGWKYTGAQREVAQKAFMDWIITQGGIAGFCASVDDFLKLIGK